MKTKNLALLAVLFALPTFAAYADDAKALYEKDCAKCHGADGKVLMKPAEGSSDDDIKALVAYMRTFKK